MSLEWITSPCGFQIPRDLSWFPKSQLGNVLWHKSNTLVLSQGGLARVLTGHSVKEWVKRLFLKCAGITNNVLNAETDALSPDRILCGIRESPFSETDVRQRHSPAPPSPPPPLAGAALGLLPAVGPQPLWAALELARTRTAELFLVVIQRLLPGTAFWEAGLIQVYFSGKHYRQF